MEGYRKILRLWLTFCSFLGFFIGWGFLADTEEAEIVSTAGNQPKVEMLNLPEIPSLSSVESSISANSNVQVFSVATPVVQVTVVSESPAPRLRTGGS